MGSGGTDIAMSPVARDKIRVSIECKNTQGAPSLSQLEQSRANLLPGTDIAAVVWKPKGARYDRCVIMFEFEECMKFLKQFRNDIVWETSIELS